MYVPAPPAQAALALAPLGIVSSTLALGEQLDPAPASAIGDVHSSALDLLDGQRLTVTGALRNARQALSLGGRLVTLQLGARHRWRTVAHTHTNEHGRFRLRYVPRWIGTRRVRLRFSGDLAARRTSRSVGRLSVYRLAAASWYGGGGSLACGGELDSSTMGVASRTLPCGTLVRLRYHGRSVRVPVVDRGPFVAGREFDLTEATKQALGFGDVGEVWSTR